MTKTISWWQMLWSIAFAAVLGTACSAEDAKPPESVRVADSGAAAAIRNQAQDFVDAFNRQDAEAIAKLWTEDANYLTGNLSVDGRPAIQQIYEDFLRAHPGSTMEIHIDSIRMLAPTVAIEQGTATVSGSPGSGPSSSAYTAVHVNQNGQWRMASVRESEHFTPPNDTELKDLSWLVGKWVAKGEAAEVEMRCEWLVNKTYLGIETSIKSSDKAETEQKGGTQIIGRDPITGEIVSWFFNGDGSRAQGVWVKDRNRWVVQTSGVMSDGTPTSATNIFYLADDQVISCQSVNRTAGGQSLPDTSEVVLERVDKSSTAAR